MLNNIIFVHSAHFFRHIRISYKTFGSRKAGAEIKAIVDRPFSLSVGYVASHRGEDVLDAAKRADALMMEEKRKFYQEGGFDRRRGAV